MAIAGSLVVTVQAKTQDFESGMRKVRTEVQTTQKAVTSAQAGFQGLTASLAALDELRPRPVTVYMPRLLPPGAAPRQRSWFDDQGDDEGDDEDAR